MYCRCVSWLSHEGDRRWAWQRVSGTEPFLAWRSQDRTLREGHLIAGLRPRPQELSTTPAERLLHLLRSRPHYGGFPRLGAAHHSSAKRIRDRLSAADTDSQSTISPQQPARVVVESRPGIFGGIVQHAKATFTSEASVCRTGYIPNRYELAPASVRSACQ